MAEAVVLNIQAREGRGSRAAYQLRKKGLVPAVVYGHKQDPQHVAIAADEFARIIRQGARVVRLDGAGTNETAVIRDIQWDHLGIEVLHADFLRRSADEKVEVSVKVEIRGTPAGLSDGGIIDQPLHAVHVECPALAVPNSIRVNIDGLRLNQAIHVRELTLPEGVKVLDDPEAVVVHLLLPGAEPEPTEPGTNEPEVITRKAEKPDEE